MNDDNSFCSFDDYGVLFEDEMSCKNNNDKLYRWKDCRNTLLISEDSLNRTLKVIKNSSFAIITAYQKRFSKRENIKRNSKLRAFLNHNEMGVHPLVGHYNEVQPDGKKVPVVERSYLVEKPMYMTDDDFKYIICGCLTIDDVTQNSALVSLKSQDNMYYLMDHDMQMLYVGKNLTLGKISNVYSQHIKKINVPFIFEGEECPTGMYGTLAFAKTGFCYAGHNGFGYMKS